MKKIDYIFLDGGHDYKTVMNDLTYSKEVILNGGTVLCDDYDLSQAPDIQQSARKTTLQKCVCVYMQARVYMHMNAYTHACMPACLHVYTPTCLHADMHAHVTRYRRDVYI